MAKYTVYYTELCYKSCEVEADSKEEAEEIVKEQEYSKMDNISENSSDVESIDEVEEMEDEE